MRMLQTSSTHVVPTPTLADQDAVVRLFAERRLKEAAAAARRLQRRFPRHVFGAKALATILGEQGLHREALAAFEQAAPMAGRDAEFANNHANCLRSLGRLPEAVVQYERALQLNASVAHVWDNLAITLQSLDRLDDAEATVRQALRLDPASASAYEHLGNLMMLRCRNDEAEEAYRASLRLRPACATVTNNLGSMFHSSGRFAEAETCLRAALTYDPKFAPAWNSLGHLLASHGLHADACQCCTAALAIDPHQHIAFSNLLFQMAHREEVTPEELFAAHVAYGERYEERRQCLPAPPHDNDRSSDRPLRLGFLSGDLHDTAVIRFFGPMLEELTRMPQYTLIAYANCRLEDSVKARLRSQFHLWRSVSLMGDDALERQIREDRIDVLVDLSGHTGSNRLPLVARKPAPIQVEWIGYVGTTGLRNVDYFIGDRAFIPPALEAQFTEKILHLPSGSPFAPLPDSPDIAPSPVLRNGYFTFGGFYRINKLGRNVIAAYAAVLRGAPQSRLRLGAMPTDDPPEHLRQWFEEEGIDPSRITYLAARGVRETLLLHADVDLCLDPFPYGGSTTNNHALWMGVPTLTLPGPTLVGRMGTALLLHVGLPEFIADDREDYIARAIAYADDPSRLVHLRPRLRAMFARSVFFDVPRIAGSLDLAFRSIWQRYCAGLPPETAEFDVQRSSTAG